MSDDEIIRNDLRFRIHAEETRLTQHQLTTFKLQFDEWKSGGYFLDGKLFHRYDEIPAEIRVINQHKIYRFECAHDGTVFNFSPYKAEQQVIAKREEIDLNASNNRLKLFDENGQTSKAILFVFMFILLVAIAILIYSLNTNP